jgi:hydroxymethylglutaryl-CoA lyase
MQGWKRLIPAREKIDYLNVLLQVGFDTLDFGSFVSPKAIPQMADTVEVLAGLRRPIHTTRLLAIVANYRGAEEASAHSEIGFLGFPFSVSETFQQANTGSSITESVLRVRDMHRLCKQRDKQLVVYLSMAFGNPYKDPYSVTMVLDWARRLAGMGITIISLADTVGLATPSEVYNLTRELVDGLPSVEIGVHLHSHPRGYEEKVAAAMNAGSRRIDGAVGGFGGCPMAGNELVGNLNTVDLVRYLEACGYATGIDHEALKEAGEMAARLFIA